MSDGSRESAAQTEDLGPEASVESPAFREQVALAQAAARLLGTPSELVLVGRYCVERRIGSGGTADVYEAVDPELSRQVAIKVVRLHGAHDAANRRERLLREARALALLDHENVVRVYDVGAKGSEVYVVMELLRGETLREWLRGRPSRPAILDALAAVGLGLAAAHEAGVVHRDVKPDNIMVGEDGRVRVLDFGLAGGEAVTRSGASAVVGSGPDTSDGDIADGRLTESGSVMGTPRYMAPEQHAGADADVRSDVFGFGAVIYEALTARFPYPQLRSRELVAAKSHGPGPRPPEIERPVWRVVRRALAPSPSARYGSMGELNVALARARGSGGRARWIGGAGLGAVVAAGLLLAPAPEDGDCDAAASRMDETWHDRREVVHQSLLTTELPFVEQTWPTLSAALDGYASAWTDEATALCQRRHAPAAPADTEPRQRCLERQRRALDALLDSLEGGPDETTVQRAVDAVGHLDPPSACLRVQALDAENPSLDRQGRERVESVRDRLAQVRVLASAGGYDAAAVLLDAAQAEVDAIDWEPLAAQALLTRGALEHERGRPDAARKALDDAWALAMANGRDRLGLEIVLARLLVESGHLESPQEADRWIARGEAWLQRMDADDRAYAQFHMRVAGIARYAGRYEEAEHHARRAVARVASMPESSPMQDEVQNSLGLVLADVGRLDEALVAFERSLAAKRARVGDSHPSVATANNNVGWTLVAQRRHAQARRYLETAVQGARASLGPDHPEVAGFTVNLAISYDEAGDHETAQRFHIEALEIRERVFGPEHPAVGRSLIDLAASYAMAGDDASARPHYVRASTIFETALGPDHPHYAITLAALGHFEVLDERWDGAIELYDRALSIYGKSLPPQHRFAVESRVALIGALLARGEDERADALLDEQRGLFRAPSESTPGEASARMRLAGILWDRGRPEAARELVQEVVHQFEPVPDPDPMLDEARAWLEAHPMPPV